MFTMQKPSRAARREAAARLNRTKVAPCDHARPATKAQACSRDIPVVPSHRDMVHGRSLNAHPTMR